MRGSPYGERVGASARVLIEGHRLDRTSPRFVRQTESNEPEFRELSDERAAPDDLLACSADDGTRLAASGNEIWVES